MAAQTVGVLAVLVGPSGSGKTDLQNALVRRGIGRRQVTCTTRVPRPGEKEGVDYFFLTPEAFRRKQASGELLESAEVHGHLYGTPKEPVLASLRAGETVILAIDIQGLRQVKAVPDHTVQLALSSFFICAGTDTIARRIIARADKLRKPVDKAELERRLQTAVEELSCREECDRQIDNDRDGEQYFMAAHEELRLAIGLRQRCVAHPFWRRWVTPAWVPRTSLGSAGGVTAGSVARA